jgi:CBS domain-containing protein
MRTVNHCLQTKGRQVWAVHPEATVYEALLMMSDKDTGALLVMDGDNLEGIFSERDYARKVILEGKTSGETQVREVMTSKVVYVRPEQTIDECMAVMTDKHVRHLPVLEAGKVVGVISIGDVVKTIISDQEFVIEQLENYISGQR